MTCNDCPFHPDNGGTCLGMIKNPAAKVPFYVCPYAGELQKIREYEHGTALKRATPLVPSVSFDPVVKSAQVRGPVLGR